jgi:3-oxoacyl-[acyl-carrier-protein] synthase-3
MEQGRNVLAIVQDPAFGERVGEVAAVDARDVLETHALSPNDVDLVVASPALPAFTKVLSAHLGVGEERILTAQQVLHTVAFVAALDQAVRTGRMWRGDKVLFVCGGAGLTAGAALYRPL